MPQLLVIDDDPLILTCFRIAFPAPDWQLRTAESAQAGIDLFKRQTPDVVIADIRLPDMTGLELFRQLGPLDPHVPFILITGNPSANNTIEAMKLGAFEYITKPLDPDKLIELAQKAVAVGQSLRIPVADTAQEVSSDLLIGACPAMRDVYKTIGRVAPQDATVLILGESGTGKEMVARALHSYSRRSEGPFLAINCAAIPDQLLESELFGHEKGAFTGADRLRIGKFEQAKGGTLFLDEVGDMSPLTQTKILRLLQEQTFERVGGNETLRADVRILAATNRDLEALMKQGAFRSDLYYRLNVFTITLPPLRERPGDLPLLTSHLLKQFNRVLGKDVRSIEPAAMAYLGRYAWPGNVRELQSILKQAMLRSSGPILLAEDLPRQISDALPSLPRHVELPVLHQFIQDRLRAGSERLLNEVQDLVDRQLFLEVLRFTNGNQTQAARILGITRPTLRSRLIALGIAIEKSPTLDAPTPDL